MTLALSSAFCGLVLSLTAAYGACPPPSSSCHGSSVYRNSTYYCCIVPAGGHCIEYDRAVYDCLSYPNPEDPTTAVYYFGSENPRSTTCTSSGGCSR